MGAKTAKYSEELKDLELENTEILQLILLIARSCLIAKSLMIIICFAPMAG